jgi:uncharacterized protein (DUF983 family)
MKSSSSVSPVSAALSGHCPRCGEGALFQRGLEFQPKCETCGLNFAAMNVGDGPAAFAILILGVVVLGGALFVEFSYGPPWWVHALLWGTLTPLLTFFLLRSLKALLIAQTYKHQAAEGRAEKGN